MTTEAKLQENQHFSVGPTDEELKIVAAKELLLRCKEWVQKGCNERDYAAFALMADVTKFVENA